MSELPAGFVLDQPNNQQSAPALPAGFTIDHPSMWEDVAKSAASGLEKGTAAAIGLPGDLATLAHSIAPQAVIDRVKAIPGAQTLYSHLPTSQAVLDSASDPLVDPNYAPQSTAGRYTQAIAKNAGPGLATGMGAAGTLGGAVAGQLAYDTTGSHTAEGLANLGVGIAAPLAMARLARRSTMPLLNADQLHDLGDAGYKNPIIRDTALAPQATGRLAGDMQDALNNSRSQFSPARAPRTTADIGRLAERAAPTSPQLTPQQQLQMQMNWQTPPPPTPAAPVTIEELHNFRKDLRDTAKEVGNNFKPTEEAAAAIKAQRVLNQYLENIPARDVVSGNPDAAVQALNDAGRNWRLSPAVRQRGGGRAGSGKHRLLRRPAAARRRLAGSG